MAGLVPAMHVSLARDRQRRGWPGQARPSVAAHSHDDGRDKRVHDGIGWFHSGRVGPEGRCGTRNDRRARTLHSVTSKGDTGNFTTVQAEKRILRCFKAECFDIVQPKIKNTEYAFGNTVGHDDA